MHKNKHWKCSFAESIQIWSEISSFLGKLGKIIVIYSVLSDFMAICASVHLCILASVHCISNRRRIFRKYGNENAFASNRVLQKEEFFESFTEISTKFSNFIYLWPIFGHAKTYWYCQNLLLLSPFFSFGDICLQKDWSICFSLYERKNFKRAERKIH